MAIYAMAAQSEIRSNFLRFDSEYFRPQHVTAFKLLGSISRGYRLGHICKKVTQGSNPFFSNNGIPCLNGKNIYFGTMQEGQPNYVSHAEYNRLRNYVLKKDDLVITLKHATKIGRAWIVEDDSPRIFSRNVGLIRLRSDSPIEPSVLLLYLWTNYGQLALDRCATGGTSGQITLPINELKRMPVPSLLDKEQGEIDAVFWRSRKAARKSFELYEQAEKLLESELGLDQLGFQKSVGYTARFSDLELSRRADAEFFNPELRFLWKELAKKFDFKAIPHFAKILKFSNPTYGTDGLPIVTQKHLGMIAPAGYVGDLVATNAWVQSNHSAVLRQKDLLYYSVGAYLGKTNLWLACDEAVPASFITILRCHEETDAGFLQLLLNSRYGIIQSKCFQSGTSQQYIYPKDIQRFLIPHVSKFLRERVHNLLIESYNKHQESARLLEEAKTRVEQLIEEAVR